MADEDDKASNDDGDSKKDDKKDKKDKKKRSGAPHWATKVMRVFIFATLGTFIAAYLFADSIPNGLRVDFDLIASIKMGLIAGVVSALLRALAAMLPVFPDD